MNILVTGAGGLIGSEAVEHFCQQGHNVYGIENNFRQVFFGPKGSVKQRLASLEHPNFTNHVIDIKNYFEVLQLLTEVRMDVVVHTAAQPSHDKAAAIPHLDFETNAVGATSKTGVVKTTGSPTL